MFEFLRLLDIFLVFLLLFGEVCIIEGFVEVIVGEVILNWRLNRKVIVIMII